MIKKIIMTALCSLCVVLVVKAQDSTVVCKTEKRNEITVSVSSFVTLFNPDDNISTLYFSYKRAFNKVKFRTSICSIVEDYTEKDPFQMILTDTTFSYLKKNYSNSYFNFKIGLQNKPRGRKIQVNYGADLLIGVERNFKKIFSEDYIIDDDVFNLVSDDDSAHLNFDYLDKTTENKFLNLGISPFVGVDYLLNKRFSIGFFLSPDIYYSMDINDNENSRNYMKFQNSYECILTFKF